MKPVATLIIFSLMFGLTPQSGFAEGEHFDQAAVTENSNESIEGWRGSLSGVLKNRWVRSAKTAHRCGSNLALLAVVSYTSIWVAYPLLQDWIRGTQAEPVKISISVGELSEPVSEFLSDSNRLEFLASYLQQRMDSVQMWRLLSLADTEGEISLIAERGISRLDHSENYPKDILSGSRHYLQFLNSDPDSPEVRKLERAMLRKAILSHWETLSEELNRAAPGLSDSVLLQDLIYGLETMNE